MLDISKQFSTFLLVMAIVQAAKLEPIELVIVFSRRRPRCLLPQVLLTSNLLLDRLHLAQGGTAALASARICTGLWIVHGKPRIRRKDMR